MRHINDKAHFLLLNYKCLNSTRKDKLYFCAVQRLTLKIMFFIIVVHILIIIMERAGETCQLGSPFLLIRKVFEHGSVKYKDTVSHMSVMWGSNGVI